jgi:adenylate kinase family enzyme
LTLFQDINASGQEREPDRRADVMKRVAVIGTSCAGKTSLARRLAEVLGARHVELDAIHWGPGWTELEASRFRELVRAAVAEDLWVVDGNYSSVRDLVWSRATAVVWLDYPFCIVFGRALSRTVRRVITREELFSGNRESFRNSFLSRGSILWWVVTTFRWRRREYRELLAQDAKAHLHPIVLKRPREADALLRTLASAPGGEASDTVL